MCLLLIPLWVRSYQVADWLTRYDSTGRTEARIGADTGALSYVRPIWPDDMPAKTPGYWVYYTTIRLPPRGHGTFWFSVPQATFIGISFWLLVPMVAAIGTSPWFPWRFSLRTLLIATTLVAMILAIIAAAN
jgi:hypothetical protein